ncbi:hypothetical protein SAMN02910275_00440 [Butyrivibrio sp. INlla18]|jgi:hypothetical protein|uniref:hypothetical protein n=1 Tax=unclassified Butyrivibrio TaxID=2639466 RepID=UPI00087FA0EE|nr:MULTISPECIES: hypothetical protein [unclassified Butyrivibrio]MBE5839829.1 hypothetical protein [Butyrivibrio sp.]SDA43401.1 hypothetical protein SAMN02910275_00440 [Butyrivibrio sp. INlla18]
MTSLLELKQYIKKFYIKNETYITYIWKFLLALVSILMINGKLGYMNSLNNFAIVMMAALLCAILPANFIVFIAAVFILGHLYALAPECAMIAAIIFVLMFLLYFRFSPKDTLAVLLTPIFYFLHIPFVMPLAMGLLGTPASAVSVAFGVVISFVISYFSSNAATFGSDGVVEAANEFHSILSGLIGNKTMIVMIVAFAITVVIVYMIRRSSADNSWKIAIACGAISLIICILIGSLVCDADISIIGVIFGTIFSALLMLVVEFFSFSLDYSRTEKVQFEDDEYYYYVKAVPKVTVSTPERKVKKINRAREQHR